MFDFIRKKNLWSALDGNLLDEMSGKLSWQLKTIQDLAVYQYLRDSEKLVVGEIGGGDSRILPNLAAKNVCYNIEKFGGADNGPVDEVLIPGVTNIHAYVGENDEKLVSDSFDLLFSVSVVEHVPDDKFEKFIVDCMRILKPGGRMIHAIDMYISDEPTDFWKNRFSMYRNTVTKRQGLAPIGPCIFGSAFVYL